MDKKIVSLLNSSDWKERFVGEYIELKTRYEKLKRCTTHMEVEENGWIESGDPRCPLVLLKEQQMYMGYYLSCLEKRAIIYDIKLPEIKF